MPAYMIVQIKITRQEGWEPYRAEVSKLFAEHGGRYLVRGGEVEVLEGSHDGRRIIVFEFPSNGGHPQRVELTRVCQGQEAAGGSRGVGRVGRAGGLRVCMLRWAR